MSYTIGIAGIAGIAVIEDPAVIGRTLGSVMQGFQETQGK